LQKVKVSPSCTCFSFSLFDLSKTYCLGRVHFFFCTDNIVVKEVISPFFAEGRLVFRLALPCQAVSRIILDGSQHAVANKTLFQARFRQYQSIVFWSPFSKEMTG
jgi:hypothetical protein